MTNRLSTIYGKNVLSITKMKEYLAKNAYNELTEAIYYNKSISMELAEHVSQAMKVWALELGATHYTHWFQPLTGTTAEKHDAFFEPDEKGVGIEKFTANVLVQQEPDASSFPSGGIRNTFEARGYTACHPSSPVLIYYTGYGKTVCIPSIFFTYTGKSLDYKTPILKSINVLDRAAMAVARYYDRNIHRVYPYLCIEQEYFL